MARLRAVLKEILVILFFQVFSDHLWSGQQAFLEKEYSPPEFLLQTFGSVEIIAAHHATENGESQ